MLSLIDVFDRAVDGPLMSDQDYYLKRYVPELPKGYEKKTEWELLREIKQTIEEGLKATYSVDQTLQQTIGTPGSGHVKDVGTHKKLAESHEEAKKILSATEVSTQIQKEQICVNR